MKKFASSCFFAYFGLFGRSNKHICISIVVFKKLDTSRLFTRIQNMSSSRAMDTDEPFIENVLDKYSDITGLTMLALGSSYWSPPAEC